MVDMKHSIPHRIIYAQMIASRQTLLYATARPTLDPVVATKLRTIRARIEDRAARLYLRQDTRNGYDLG